MICKGIYVLPSLHGKFTTWDWKNKSKMFLFLVKLALFRGGEEGLSGLLSRCHMYTLLHWVSCRVPSLNCFADFGGHARFFNKDLPIGNYYGWLDALCFVAVCYCFDVFIFDITFLFYLWVKVKFRLSNARVMIKPKAVGLLLAPPNTTVIVV